MKKELPEELKQEIIRKHNEGVSLRKLTEEFSAINSNATLKVIRNLIAKARAQGTDTRAQNKGTVKGTEIETMDGHGHNEKTGTGTEAEARAQGTTTKNVIDDRETIKDTDEGATPDDKPTETQKPVIIVQAAKDLRNYSSYKDKCRIAKEAINQILNELEFSQWTIDNINSLFDNATRSQRQELEISQEDTKEFFGFDGTYTELQKYFRNKMESAWLEEVS